MPVERGKPNPQPCPPHRTLQKLTELAIDLRHADSAGISILEPDGRNGVFRWHAVAGRFAAHVGGTMPREAARAAL
jgi:hypothetical protein